MRRISRAFALTLFVNRQELISTGQALFCIITSKTTLHGIITFAAGLAVLVKAIHAFLATFSCAETVFTPLKNFAFLTNTILKVEFGLTLLTSIGSTLGAAVPVIGAFVAEVICIHRCLDVIAFNTLCAEGLAGALFAFFSKVNVALVAGMDICNRDKLADVASLFSEDKGDSDKR